MKHVACDNTIGQFNPIGEISGKKKNEQSKIKFVLPQVLLCDATSNQVVEWSMKQKVQLVKQNESQPTEKNRIKQINSDKNGILQYLTAIDPYDIIISFFIDVTPVPTLSTTHDHYGRS
ncbi:21384_t:CDS:2, partial [Cetraspora pellucida]